MTQGLEAAGTLGDVELMQRVQAGDRDAFGVLYDRFGSRAYRLALTIARDEARAEDIVQEAFVALWLDRATYRRERGAVAGWVMVAVRDRAVDTVRHDEQRVDDPPATGAAGDEAVERDQAERLRAALARIPEAQRDVIALAYFGELSAPEIADQLSLPPGTVKGRMRLGLQKLREGPQPHPEGARP